MEELQQILESSDWKSLERYLKGLFAEETGKKQSALEGRWYYENRNAITRRSGMENMVAKAMRDNSPLRNADFRIPHNWHQLLVNQKVSYLFSHAPIFDCGFPQGNQKITAALGKGFSRMVKNLAIDAANCGTGWLHLWQGAEGVSYATMPMEEIFPIAGDSLSGELSYVIRIYEVMEEKNSAVKKIEIWDKDCGRFFIQGRRGQLTPDCRFGENSNVLFHGFCGIPFVPFYNNRSKTGDLVMVKELIDQYDLVMSGFANDLADIQEVIFVLRNYGGEDLNTFLSELKRYKAIKVEGDSVGDGGVETMKIEIPVDARVKFLEILKKQIFISGQGVNPDPEAFGNSSGVALKYLYSLLEIKAGLLETEFRAGFQQFLSLLLPCIGMDKNTEITQIFTRNAIENDAENAEIAVKSQDCISKKTLLLHHPWVDDAEKELAEIGSAGESAK